MSILYTSQYWETAKIVKLFLCFSRCYTSFKNVNYHKSSLQASKAQMFHLTIAMFKTLNLYYKSIQSEPLFSYFHFNPFLLKHNEFSKQGGNKHHSRWSSSTTIAETGGRIPSIWVGHLTGSIAGEEAKEEE